jgi:hypothetical protein
MEALLLTIEVASGLLGICPKTARNWISEKRFPIATYRLNGRRMIRRSDLVNFVDSLGGKPSDPQPARQGRPRR